MQMDLVAIDPHSPEVADCPDYRVSPGATKLKAGESPES